MKDTFRNFDEGSLIFTDNGERIFWTNEDNRGKTCVEFKYGDIWVIPTPEEGFKVKLRIAGYDLEEVIFTPDYEPGDYEGEEKLWEKVEGEVDRMLTKLGFTYDGE